MTPVQLAQVAALSRCTFLPGSAEKRFVRDLHLASPKWVLTRRQAQWLNALAHRHRDQLGKCLADGCAKCDTAEREAGSNHPDIPDGSPGASS